MKLAENITKLFYDDVRQKKKSANGIHCKTGTRGLIGKVRFATDLMSPKEKAEYTKSGKVVVFSMNDILKYEQFKKLSKKEQKEYLIIWRNLYNNNEIIEKMDIPKSEYFDIARGFGILNSTGRRRGNKIQLSDGRMEYYLNNLIDYKNMRNLDEEQKAILFDAYLSQFNNKKDLANVWGISNGAIYSLSDRLNKWKIKNGCQNILNEYLKEKGFIIGDLSNKNAKGDAKVKEEPKIVLEDEQCIENDKLDYEIISEHKDDEIKIENKHIINENISSGMGFTINGIFEADILKNRLEKIVNILDGEASKFKIELKIIETEFFKCATECDTFGDTKDKTQEIDELNQELSVKKDKESIFQSEHFKKMIISFAELMKSNH